MTRTVRRVATVAAFTTGAACAPEEPQPLHAVRDSAGVEIVESNGPEWVESGWTINPEPVLQIGVTEGASELQLFDVTDVRQLSDGRIAVINAGTRTVKIFDTTGELSIEFGGPGDGPGEFRRPTSLHVLPGDTLMVWDYQRASYSLYSSTGDLILSQRLMPPGSESLGNVFPFGADRVLAFTLPALMGSPERRGPGIHRGVVTALVYGARGRLIDTLGIFPGIETAVLDVEGRVLGGPTPFPKATYAATREGSLVIGTASEMQVATYDLEGTLRSVFRHADAELALQEDDRTWYREHMAKMVSNPMEERLIGSLLDALIFPESRAAYSGLAIDAGGAVWLRTGRHFPPLAPSTEWTVFSPVGVLLGTVELPERFEPYDFGDDYVLGVWRDELDVEFVRLYEVQKGSDARPRE